MPSLKQQAKQGRKREAKVQALSFGSAECRKELRKQLDNRLWQERGNNTAKPRKGGAQPVTLTARGKGRDGFTYKDFM